MRPALKTRGDPAAAAAAAASKP
uniref:Uncharacterized protein n=1 Tax=Arundo donax TaxID=35708 RepID=A0A0A9AEH9_ARUDO